MVQSLVLHALNAILSLFLFGIFLWWWLRIGDATKIYKLTCFLMLGIFLTHSLAAFKYCLVMHCGFELNDVYAWYFSLHQLLILFPLLGYLFHVIDKIKKRSDQ